MENQYATLPKIAKIVEMSYWAVKRYVKNYRDFFNPRIIEGWDQYPVEETVKVLKIINDYATVGKRSRIETAKAISEKLGINNKEDMYKEAGAEMIIRMSPDLRIILESMADSLTAIRSELSQIVKSGQKGKK